tara:strand:+ start:1102 stop:1389 length:288 start_codon:yes stop_codon:yes gene_type:complete
MSIDPKTAKKIAKLAQIETNENELEHLSKELSNILKFMEQLNDVDVTNVAPLTSVTPMELKLRSDEITDGDKRSKILMNAPVQSEGFFAVPKVIE